MKLAVGSWRSAVDLRMFRMYGIVCLLLTAICQLECSLPNMESQNCVDAREAVREFYSVHYANDIAPTPENLKLRQKFLTPELYQALLSNPPQRDYFTDSDTPPKAFKVAACSEASPQKAIFGVHLFWKPDDRTNIQREATVEALKQEGTWLVNKVTIEK